MTLLFWFAIGFIALIALLVTLLFVQQHRTRDTGRRLDPRDAPTESDAVRAASSGSTRRLEGYGPF